MGRSQSPLHARRGFTLVELVIVLLVIGVLATMIVPNYRQSVIRAEGAQVATRVEAINVALKEYEADHDSIPTGTGPAGSAPSWLAPYLTANHFQGPAGITFQYAHSGLSVPPTLVIAAGAVDERMILLAAAASLGSRATTVGGGASLLVTLSE